MKEILLMGGEGIGPEIVAASRMVLERTASLFGIPHRLTELLVGLDALPEHGTVFPREAEEACDRVHRERGAILFGAVSDEPIGILRKKYDLFANLRPFRMHDALLDRSPLRPDRVTKLDILIVRELTSGLYYGETTSGIVNGQRWAAQEMRYSADEARRICRVALDYARRRRKKLTYVHKNNVIKEIFGIWADVLAEEHRASPDVVVEDILVDNMAMQMVLRPESFDVVLAENLFGDILSDLAAGIVGSIGLIPSASLGPGLALYESIGGTAPDIAGKDIANPCSTILSVALLFRYTLQNEAAAVAIERAVDEVLASHRTADIGVSTLETVSTSTMGALVADAVRM